MAEEQSPTDHEAFLRLFTRFEGNLRAFVASLLPTREGVDDVMQESSVVLWRKFPDSDQSGADSDFLGWAFMIARYEVLKYRRRRATDRLQFSEDVFELLAGEATTLGNCPRHLATKCAPVIPPFAWLPRRTTRTSTDSLTALPSTISPSCRSSAANAAFGTKMDSLLIVISGIIAMHQWV
ncbi:MAG: sigma factor [Pirellulaceae bacterium]